MSSRARSLFNNIVLAVVVCSALIGVTELAFRATHLFGARRSWAQPDDWLRWRFTPGREYWYFSENDHPITGRINSHGWRDRERTFEKPEGGFRVAVLGDSYVAAFEVESESTMCAIVERDLRKTNPLAEVLNFGRVGMTVTEELIVLERDALRFDPDVVVLVFAPINDIRDVDRRTAVPALRPFFLEGEGGELVLDRSFRGSRSFKIRSAINSLKQHSALFSLISERYNAMRFVRRQSKVDAPTTIVAGASTMSGHLSLCTDVPDTLYAANYLLCKRLIGRAAQTCRRNGVRFVLVSINNVYIDEKIDALRSVNPTFDPDFFDRDLLALADTSGFDLVGLQGVFRERYLATGQRLHWAHWNYEGHRAAAGALLETLGSVKR